MNPRALVATLAISASPLLAARPPLEIDLKFTPTTAIGVASPSISPQALARTLTLEVLDARTGLDPAVIGQGTDDDDSTFPAKATGAVLDVAREAFRKLAGDWGLKLDDAGDMVLKVSVTRWSATERNQAVGSWYTADVGLGGELVRGDGTVAWRGVASGDTGRYGNKQSAGNYNESLSDAAQEALASLLSSGDLQKALEGGVVPVATNPTELPRAPAPQPAAATVDPDTVLKDVASLAKNGFSLGFLVEYVQQVRYSRPLTAADLIQWKDAGIPEVVISAAMKTGA